MLKNKEKTRYYPTIRILKKIHFKKSRDKWDEPLSNDSNTKTRRQKFGNEPNTKTRRQKFGNAGSGKFKS